MRLDFLTVFALLCWLGVWIGGSIIYRRASGRPLFPRAPDNAVFREAWASGRSLRNMLTSIGGARNCLLVYVADGALTIVPTFPFNLMFLPEIYGLETTVPLSDVGVTDVGGLIGRRLLLTIHGVESRRFELRLRNAQGFRAAIQGKRLAPASPTEPMASERPRAGWRLNLFRVFAVVWGLGATAAGVTGLEQDVRFRSHGMIAAGRIVGHSDEDEAGNIMGIVQYQVGGRSYRLTSIRGSGVYRIGDPDQVRYMADAPASAREDDYLAFDLLFAGLGSFMLILALTAGRIARLFTRFVTA